MLGCLCIRGRTLKVKAVKASRMLKMGRLNFMHNFVFLDSTIELVTGNSSLPAGIITTLTWMGLKCVNFPVYMVS